jgi:tetratricopeptide (TPR) repeat protein
MIGTEKVDQQDEEERDRARTAGEIPRTADDAETKSRSPKKKSRPSREKLLSLGVTRSFLKTFLKPSECGPQTLLQPGTAYATRYSEARPDLPVGEDEQGSGSRIRVKAGGQCGKLGTVIRCVKYPDEYEVLLDVARRRSTLEEVDELSDSTVILANHQLEYLYPLNHPQATVDQLRDMIAMTTADSGESLVEWLYHHPNPSYCTGQANVFLALGQLYPIASLLAAMDRYATETGADPDTTYFSVDIFNVRQHVHGNMFKCEMADLELLPNAIAAIDPAATVFVVDPWEKHSVNPICHLNRVCRWISRPGQCLDRRQLAIVDPVLETLKHWMLAQAKQVVKTHKVDYELMSHVGRFYQSLKMYDKAQKLLEKALRGTEDPRTVHRDDATALLSVKNLGELLIEKGELPEALKLMQRHSDSAAKEYGEDDPITLQSLRALASLHRKMGHENVALPLFERVLAARHRLFGEKHVATLESVDDLGMLYEMLDRYADALTLFERSHRDHKERLGVNHGSTLLAMDRLGLLYEREKRLSDALPLFERAFEVTKEDLGPDHDNTIFRRNNLDRIFATMTRTGVVIIGKTHLLQSAGFGDITAGT